MECLKITASNGTYQIVPDSNVVNIGCAANSNNNSGKITSVKYLNGANAAAPTLTVVATVAAWDGTNTKYEYGCLTETGELHVYLTN
jgi:hypothetical protein